MGANKVKYGFKNVKVAKITEGTDSQGNTTITYGTPFALPGGVSLSLDAEGDSTDFYADNTKYFSNPANNGYSGDLEIAMIPDQFYTDILGQTTDKNGALIESNEDKISPFALMFEVDGDKKNRRAVFYNCTATRPSTSAETVEDTNDPKTDTLSITIAPRSTDGKVKATLELSDTNKTAYDAFFTTVYEETV